MNALRNASRGFTLIELITVLAVLSILTAIGTRALFAITDGWETISTRTALNVRATATFDAMRADFGQTLSPSLSGAPLLGTEAVAESFDSDVIAFPVESTEAATGKPERSMVSYAIAREGTPALIRTEYPLGAKPETGTRTVVAENVTAMRIEYDDGANWTSGWNSPQMPKAVRVTLLMRDADRPWEQLSRRTAYGLFVE